MADQTGVTVILNDKTSMKFDDAYYSNTDSSGQLTVLTGDNQVVASFAAGQWRYSFANRFNPEMKKGASGSVVLY